MTQTSQSPGDGEAAPNKTLEMDNIYSDLARRYDDAHASAPFNFFLKSRSDLIERIAAKPGDKLLDMAAGTGYMAMYYLQYQDTVNNDATSSAVLFDLNQAMLDGAKHKLADTDWSRDGRLTYVQGNAEDLSVFPDNSFDIYCCGLGFHNMPSRDVVLREAFRVLKPGGMFAALEANSGSGRIGRKFMPFVYRHFVIPKMRAKAQDWQRAQHVLKSGMAFPPPAIFAAEIRAAGFESKGKGFEYYRCRMVIGYIGAKPI